MQKPRVPIAFVAVFACVAAIWPAGCTTPATTSYGVNDLSTSEKSGIQAAMRSFISVQQATTACRGVSLVDSPQEGQLDPTAGLSFTVGTCPVVEFEQSSGNLAIVTVSADFGEGCNPAGAAEYTCSGSASGTLNVSTNTFSMTFNALLCNGRALAGTVDAGYSADQGLVQFDGDWELTYTEASRQTATQGAGQALYSDAQRETTVPAFEGTVQESAESYALTMSDVTLSYQNNPVLIPYAGEITVSGSSIRALTIHFDADSPTTGYVEVSIDGSPYFEVHISQL
ncbi:MAG: hypothetical protein HRF50_05690 [Phycisphaerae bacterium]|jgi:hypothetical protein